MSKSWEQILGGYATDTLTDEEKRELFEAALHDQALFDALADEEALKVLLTDPDARQRILARVLASEESHGSAKPHGATLHWFRKPSSLAWAGSIAAAGLALIFGWQMNKDWGPMIQQEMEAERSVSDDKTRDDHEMVFRTQTPETHEMKEPTQDFQKQDQSQPKRVADSTAPVSSPLLSTIAKASKEAERMRQPLAQDHAEDIPRLEVKKERRLKAEKSVSRPPESAIVQNFAREEQVVAPSVASPEAKEKGFQQLARAPSFADRRQEERDDRSSPSARELFYANKNRGVDAVGEDLDGMRARQPLGGLSSQVKKGFVDEVSDLKKSTEIDQDDSSRQTRGIRYRFFSRAVNGKEEAINIMEFPGKWSDLHLAIESNVSGHLYILTSFGKGKWQWVRPESSNVPRSSEGGIQVKAYQPVDFALSQMTNILGKPVVSSITVLLSSVPLMNLGRLLGGNDDMSEVQIEREKGEVLVVETTAEPGSPFKMEIVLK